MVRPIEIVWWETSLTDHQAYTLSELASDATVSVIVVKYQNKERKNQGWVPATAQSLKTSKIPEWNFLFFILKAVYYNRKKIHVFGGLFEHPKLMFGALLGIIFGIKIYFLSEPYSISAHGLLRDGNRYINVLKAKFRPILYVVYGKIFLKYVNGILAVSPLAVKQLLSIGAKKYQIFPFGYFVPRTKDPLFKKCTTDNFKAVFVGTLNGTKGVDILSRVVNSLNVNGFPLELDVFGPGDPAILGNNLKGVNYCGVIPFGETQQVVSSYDLFILPSRYDGWGVVVNEAILAGVPVLCSDRVGAAGVIKKFGCGIVYSSSKDDDLFNNLKNLMLNRNKLEKMRKSIEAAQLVLDPKVASYYILNMIANGKQDKLDQLESPWYDVQEL